MTVKFTIPGVPVGKARPRVTMHGTYTPKKTRDYEAMVRRCYLTQCEGAVFPAGIPVFASVIAWFSVPKSYSKKRREALLEGRYYLKKPDADNVAKSVLDALNGVAFPDDAAVQIGGVYKFYTNAAPRVEVTLMDNVPEVTAP